MFLYIGSLTILTDNSTTQKLYWHTSCKGQMYHIHKAITTVLYPASGEIFNEKWLLSHKIKLILVAIMNYS